MQFECSLDDKQFKPCGEGLTGQWTGTNVPDGRHNFKVKGTDSNGNEVEAEVRGWIVDAVPPVITYIRPPTKTNGSPEITWRSSEQATFECSLDGGPYENCGNGLNGRWFKNNVRGGSRVLSVRGRDTVGNLGRSRSHTWTVGKLFFIMSLMSSCNILIRWIYVWNVEDNCNRKTKPLYHLMPFSVHTK